MTKLRAFLYVAFLALPCPNAQAYVRNLAFSPSPVTAYQPLHLTIDAGRCHAFSDFDVTTRINGTVVDLVMNGAQEDDPLFCSHPDFTYHYDIAGLPPGELTMRVSIKNIVSPFEVYPPALTTPVFVGLPAAQVPSNAMASLVTVIVLLLFVGLARLRRRNSRTILVVTCLLSFGAPIHVRAETSPEVGISAHHSHDLCNATRAAHQNPKPW